MLFHKHYNHKMWQMLNISLQVGTGFNTKVLEDTPFTERLLNTGKQISVIYFFWILTYLFILFRFSPLCWLWFIPFTSVLFIWGFFYSACCFLAFFFYNYLSFFSKRSVSFQFILYCFYDQYLLLTEKPSLSSPMIYLLFSFVCFFSLHSIVSFSLFPTTFNLLYSLFFIPKAFFFLPLKPFYLPLSLSHYGISPCPNLQSFPIQHMVSPNLSFLMGVPSFCPAPEDTFPLTEMLLSHLAFSPFALFTL